MYFNFRFPNNEEKEQISDAEQGLLKVEVPHWASEVKVYDSSLQPIDEIGKIRSDKLNIGGYISETTLSPGVYQVETSLEGRTSSEWIPVRPNQVTHVSNQAWEKLEFTSSAPLDNTASSREWHQQPAMEWSRQETWKYTKGGNSRLFLFVRTLKPERYRETFANGLQLLNENGELVTDLTNGIVENKTHGWLAFNAYLPSGGYILRRGRSGVRLRSQVIYLCDGWKTQVFLTAKRFPSLSTMSLNMTRLESGFQASDQTSLAAEAILNNLRFGADIKTLFSNDKIENILDTLLDQKKENPWLGVLVAHIILKFREETDRQRKSEALSREKLDFSEYFQILENKVKPFLQRTIPAHPDVRAILLSENSPSSFHFPPLLWASFRQIQEFAVNFAEVIPKDSLTDCLLDSLVVNSPWTAWRRLAKMPRAISPDFLAEKRVFDINPEKIALFSASCAPLNVPKSPIFSLPSTEEDILTNKKSAIHISPQTVLQNIPIVQKAAEMVQDYVQANRLEDLPAKAKLNSNEKINEILNNVETREISRNVGLPLSRTETGLENLKLHARNIQADEAISIKAEKSLIRSQQAILKYALSKIGQNISESSGDDSLNAQVLSSLVARLQIEADRIWLNCAESKEEKTARKLAEKLDKISLKLLKTADFVFISRRDGRIIYSNRAFIHLISSRTKNRLSESDEVKRKKLLEILRLWESALVTTNPGFSFLQNPQPNPIFQTFELHRTEIEDEADRSFINYLNIFRIKETVSLADEQLKEIDLLISDLSQYALLFAYGSGDKRKEYFHRLQEITDNLEVIWRETKNLKEKNMAERENQENTANELNISSLYEREFFGVSRHNLISGTAERLLLSQKAKNRVRFLLDPLGQTMADVGGWADEIKQSSPPDDPDTQQFLTDARNANHRNWHFVNLPLGAVGYSREIYPDFTRSDDVVQIIQESILVLLGSSTRFSELNAFRLICHLVGDIHQPIHVGCGYLEKSGNTAKLVFDPQVIRQKNLKSDLGGNSLLMPIGNNLSLHSYWDSKLGGNVTDLSDPILIPNEIQANETSLKTKALEKLFALVQQDETVADPAADVTFDEPLSPEKLVENWTTASLETAKQAYHSLQITVRQGNKYKVSWEGREAYDKRCQPVVINQMKAAARNLAKLLDAIWK
jgi:hypothetical protein